MTPKLNIKLIFVSDKSALFQVAFFVLVFCGAASPVSAQPFACDGSIYSVFSPEVVNSRVYIVTFDSGQDSVVFNPLTSPTGIYINAIGYRKTDNFIYGINPPNQDLYRVDAGGGATFLGSLQGLDPNHEYISGEVTPDGRYLLLQGGNGGNTGIEDTEIVYVNLEDPYTTSTVPIQTLSGRGLRCADIAFDPNTQVLYGYDGLYGRLVTIDPVSGVIDDTKYPAFGTARVMASLYFDAFGNLFGYGQPRDSMFLNTFFRINKDNGEIYEMAKGPVADRNDGCTCPYGIELEKTVEPTSIIACNEVVYTFKISNASSAVQGGIVFQDILPPGFTILEVGPNPYSQEISGIGTNHLIIENMNIRPGIDSFYMRVDVGLIDPGTYYNQAELINIPSVLGTREVSDNPRTNQFDDSTALVVLALETDIDSQIFGICPGETATIDATAPGNPTYEWNTGADSPIIEIDEGGTYWVKLTSDCEIFVDTAVVIEADSKPIVDLGPDQEIFLGEQITLPSSIEGTGNYSFRWFENEGSSLSCIDCESPNASPFTTTDYILEVTDEFGCVGTDVVTITVDVDERIFIPNVFSPNRDDINDVFFVQGIMGTLLNSVHVYDRAGELVFSRENIPVNDMALGWDGTFKGVDLNPGVYAWIAEIQFFDNSIKIYAGDVTLIR